jgi:hypothetical protein
LYLCSMSRTKKRSEHAFDHAVDSEWAIKAAPGVLGYLEAAAWAAPGSTSQVAASRKCSYKSHS